MYPKYFRIMVIPRDSFTPWPVVSQDHVQLHQQKLKGYYSHSPIPERNIRSYPKGTRTLKHPDLFQTNQDSQKDPVPAHQTGRSCLQDSLFWLFQVVHRTDRKNSCTMCEWDVCTFDVNNSALSEQVISTNHKIVWDNTTVIDWHAFTHPRCTMESWHIHKEEDALNREKGLLPDVYLTLQSSHKFDTQPNACDTDQCVWPLQHHACSFTVSCGINSRMFL